MEAFGGVITTSLLIDSLDFATIIVSALQEDIFFLIIPPPEFPSSDSSIKLQELSDKECEGHRMDDEANSSFLSGSALQAIE